MSQWRILPQRGIARVETAGARYLDHESWTAQHVQEDRWTEPFDMLIKKKEGTF